MNLQNNIQEIQRTYMDISVAVDKQSGKKSRVYNYSHSFSCLPSTIKVLQDYFPRFKFSNIYNEWWLVYFNKKSNWGELMLPNI